MRRHMIRPFGQSIAPTRIISLIGLLVLLWVASGWVKNPAIWRWIAKPEGEQQTTNGGEFADTLPQASMPVTSIEQVVPGPNDTDPTEALSIKEKLDLVTDKAPLRPGEMPLYWKFLGWSRTESFDDLNARAKHGVPFSQMWEESKRRRGQLTNLKLHVRRVLSYEVDANPLGLKRVHEAWGWTDDSKSYPYVIVFSEWPEGLPLGSDVRAEVEFVGYYLKVMSYTAFDVSRGSPLLVGRVKLLEPPSERQSSLSSGNDSIMIAAIGFVAIVGIGVWQLLGRKRQKRSRELPAEMGLNLPQDWTPGSSPAEIDLSAQETRSSISDS
jgi:hypothetical protein